MRVMRRPAGSHRSPIMAVVRRWPSTTLAVSLWALFFGLAGVLPQWILAIVIGPLIPSYLVMLLGTMLQVATLGSLDAPWKGIVSAVWILLSFAPYFIFDWVLGPPEEWRIRRPWSVRRSDRDRQA